MTTRREANIEATKAALLAEARAMFASHGFSGAELGEIAARAGVTTGAIYHHFGSKTALFATVAEELEREILVAAASAVDLDPLVRLRHGFELLIDVCARPEIQRIVFIEAAQVLGPEAWRETELKYAFGALRAILATMTEQKVIEPYPIDLLARVLLALLREVSGEVSRSKDDPAVRSQARALVDSVLDGLFRRASI